MLRIRVRGVIRVIRVHPSLFRVVRVIRVIQVSRVIRVGLLR